MGGHGRGDGGGWDGGGLGNGWSWFDGEADAAAAVGLGEDLLTDSITGLLMGLFIVLRGGGMLKLRPGSRWQAV